MGILNKSDLDINEIISLVSTSAEVEVSDNMNDAEIQKIIDKEVSKYLDVSYTEDELQKTISFLIQQIRDEGSLDDNWLEEFTYTDIWKKIMLPYFNDGIYDENHNTTVWYIKDDTDIINDMNTMVKEIELLTSLDLSTSIK